MKRIPIFFVMAAVMLSLMSCSGDENEVYKRGYDDGYADGRAKHFAEGHDKGFAEGKQQGLTEGYDDGFAEGEQQGLTGGKSSLDSLVRDAYDKGYQAGVTEAPETLVKVLSYNIADATTVVGELHNVSDKALNVLVIGALLDSNGEVLVVSSSLWRRYVQEQQKMPFQLSFPPSGLYPADVRLNVIWY